MIATLYHAPLFLERVSQKQACALRGKSAAHAPLTKCSAAKCLSGFRRTVVNELLNLAVLIANLVSLPNLAQHVPLIRLWVLYKIVLTD